MIESKEEYLSLLKNMHIGNVTKLLTSYAEENGKEITADQIRQFKNTGLIQEAINIAMTYYDNKFVVTKLSNTNLKW